MWFNLAVNNKLSSRKTLLQMLNRILNDAVSDTTKVDSSNLLATQSSTYLKELTQVV
jgi:hypothetical protein